MFVVSKRNILLPSADGSRVFPVSRGFIGEVPDWAAETEYFSLLVQDGKLGVPESKLDDAVEATQEQPVQVPPSKEPETLAAAVEATQEQLASRKKAER